MQLPLVQHPQCLKMGDAIESNLVSRRRIQFETVHELNQQSPHNKPLQQAPRVADSPSDNPANRPQQKHEVGIMQNSGTLPVLIEAPTLMLAYAQFPPNMRPVNDSDKESFSFTDYSGCFTDDGSPLIEQQGLSEPLLKRDRQQTLGHISITAASPQMDFSLASQQLLLQQHQLQQQLAQQQQHLQKLNVSLQDTGSSRGSGNGHELGTEVALAAVSSPSIAVGNQGSSQQHSNPLAQSSSSGSSSGHRIKSQLSLASSPLSSASGIPQHAQQQPPLSPGTGIVLEHKAQVSPMANKESPQLGPSNVSQLEVYMYIHTHVHIWCFRKFKCGAIRWMMLIFHRPMQVAMHHFLQFREASHKKMNLLEQENMALKSKLRDSTFQLQSLPQTSGTDMTAELEQRLVDMKMSYDQQMLDLQVGAAFVNAVLYLHFSFAEASCH